MGIVIEQDVRVIYVIEYEDAGEVRILDRDISNVIDDTTADDSNIVDRQTAVPVIKVDLYGRRRTVCRSDRDGLVAPGPHAVR